MFYIIMMKGTKHAALLLLILTAVFQPTGSLAQKDTKTISIKVMPGLQFDLVRFAVKPGEKVNLLFTNTDDMAHNLLITRPGAREAVVQAALQLAEKGPAQNYIPNTANVLWSIPVIGPDEKATLSFTAPAKKGVYPYVCTFPGHGFVMYGAMYVTDKQELPDIGNDLNIPESRRKENGAAGKTTGHGAHTAKPAHPYVLKPPYLYRVFIEGAGPAAIAVRLPHQLSYCWDAGSCRLRFAWTGDFVDNSALWAGHKDATAAILGEVFYRDKTAYPLRIKDPGVIPATAFKGYRLVDRYPEFHYTIDGTSVYELIKPEADGSGLVRTFRIPGAAYPVWFVFTPGDGIKYTSSAGSWEGNKLVLSAEEAGSFVITMTRDK
ncbi:MAG TPA: plastocyanin/azurin family copper-binding protein [Flavitalea sp.]|nr:plastocyanin/azurin family copper-binding protein [Flavitalea sp.]